MSQYVVVDAVNVAARDVRKFAHWEVREVPKSFSWWDFVDFVEGRMLFIQKGFEYHVPSNLVKIV